VDERERRTADLLGIDSSFGRIGSPEKRKGTARPAARRRTRSAASMPARLNTTAPTIASTSAIRLGPKRSRNTGSDNTSAPQPPWEYRRRAVKNTTAPRA
jgi:hypothetical protein